MNSTPITISDGRLTIVVDESLKYVAASHSLVLTLGYALHSTDVSYNTAAQRDEMYESIKKAMFMRCDSVQI